MVTVKETVIANREFEPQMEMDRGSDCIIKNSYFKEMVRGTNNYYAFGFTKHGLLGASMDARRIVDDVEKCLKNDLYISS